jgi:phenylacetate-CoA ligase
VKRKLQAAIWNEQAERLPADQLEHLQLRELRQLLTRLQTKVPFFREKLSEAGMTAEKIRSIKDLRSLPPTTKSQLSDHYPFGLFAEPLKNVSRIHASSGTRGKPTVVGYTKLDLGSWAELCARSLVCAGVQPGDIVQNSYGYGLFTGGLGLHYGAEKVGTTVIPTSTGRTQNQIMLLRDFGANILLCTPSYALSLAYELDELSLSEKDLNLAIGIFGAEPWTEQLRAQIESKLGISALDIYGLSEIIGPGVSMECWQGAHQGAGLHIWEDHFLVEVLDPKSSEPLPDGEEGELVFTTLKKEALPLLRYRTGDLGSISRRPCVCGRTMARMSRVRARLDDMLIIRGVNLYPSEVERVILDISQLAPHYQLILGRSRALDTMAVEVELDESVTERWGTFDQSHPEFLNLTKQVELRLKQAIGLQASVKLMKPKSIPRSTGKAARVIDRRHKNGSEEHIQ